MDGTQVIVEDGSTQVIVDPSGEPTVITVGIPGPAGGSTTIHARIAPVESPNGTLTTFTLPQPYVAGSLSVFLNGLYESHITETSTTTFTFQSAPYSGDEIMLVYAT